MVSDDMGDVKALYDETDCDEEEEEELTELWTMIVLPTWSQRLGRIAAPCIWTRPTVSSM